jgi:hypothetical protein
LPASFSSNLQFGAAALLVLAWLGRPFIGLPQPIGNTWPWLVLGISVLIGSWVWPKLPGLVTLLGGVVLSFGILQWAPASVDYELRKDMSTMERCFSRIS